MAELAIARGGTPVGQRLLQIVIIPAFPVGGLERTDLAAEISPGPKLVSVISKPAEK